MSAIAYLKYIFTEVAPPPASRRPRDFVAETDAAMTTVWNNIGWHFDDHSWKEMESLRNRLLASVKEIDAYRANRKRDNAKRWLQAMERDGISIDDLQAAAPKPPHPPEVER